MKATLTLLFGICISSCLMAQAYPDRHSTTWKDAWVSCEIAESPNTKRDPGYWIMYDFGDQYALHESTFWNNNVPGETGRGMNQIIIDYSHDGQQWEELSTFSLPQGPGDTFYQGDDGPDFGGAVARYVLISGISNHGGDCFSLSEVRINAAITTTTSFAENELIIDMDVAPNPASNYAKVTLSELPEGMVKYQITSMSGKMVSDGVVTKTTFDVDVSSLATGAYTLTLYNSIGLKSSILNVISE